MEKGTWITSACRVNCSSICLRRKLLLRCLSYRAHKKLVDNNNNNNNNNNRGHDGKNDLLLH